MTNANSIFTFAANRYFDLYDRWRGTYICTIAYGMEYGSHVWRVEDEQGAIDEKTYPDFAPVTSRAMRNFLASEYGIADDYKVREV